MDAERRLLQQTVKAYERSLTVTQNRYNAGIAAQVDIESSRTQLDNGRTQLLALDWPRAQPEHAIAVLLRLTPASFSLAPSELVARAPVFPEWMHSKLVQRTHAGAAAAVYTEVPHAAFDDTVK